MAVDNTKNSSYLTNSIITRFKFCIYILCLFFFVNAIDIYADFSTPTYSDIYTVEVPIASDSLNDRNKAFSEGLKKVLIGLTHRQEVIIAAPIKNKLNKAEIYVKSYNYSHKANIGQQDLFLTIAFDPRGIEQLLSQAEIKIPKEQTVDAAESNESSAFKENAKDNQQPIMRNFSEGKVDVLVWLTILGVLPKDNVLLTDSSVSDLAVNFKNDARQSGISILLPVMDLSELSEITADDICNLNTEVVEKASKKYNSGAIMIGCISRSLTGKKGQWLLLLNKKQYAWIFYGENDEDILKQALASISNVLFSNSKNAIKQEAKNPDDIDIRAIEKITIKIEGVSSLEQYNNVIKYLQSIAPIRNVELLSLNSSYVELRIAVLGGRDAFITALASPEQNKLIMVNDNNNNVLDYKLVEY